MIELLKGHIYSCDDFLIWLFKESQDALSVKGFYGTSILNMAETTKKHVDKQIQYSVDCVKPNNMFLILETPLAIEDHHNDLGARFLLKVLVSEKIGWIKIHHYMHIQKWT
jgi:hypothetical protein